MFNKKEDMKIYYKQYLKNNSRILRNNQTKEEKLVWFYLRKKQIYNQRFFRQKPVGSYIVDFICPKLKLIIEVDGSDHDYKYDEDVIRQKELESLGFCFFRVRNEEVRDNLLGVIKSIEMKVQSLKKI